MIIENEKLIDCELQESFEKRFVVPDTVSVLACNSISNCQSLEEIFIHRGVENIEYGAIVNNKNLKRIVFDSAFLGNISQVSEISEYLDYEDGLCIVGDGVLIDVNKEFDVLELHYPIKKISRSAFNRMSTESNKRKVIIDSAIDVTEAYFSPLCVNEIIIDGIRYAYRSCINPCFISTEYWHERADVGFRLVEVIDKDKEDIIIPKFVDSIEEKSIFEMHRLKSISIANKYFFLRQNSIENNECLEKVSFPNDYEGRVEQHSINGCKLNENYLNVDKVILGKVVIKNSGNYEYLELDSEKISRVVKYAFSGSNIETLLVKGNIKIEPYAFAGANIRKLIIVGTKRIRTYSFSMIRNLKELILDNVEGIERSALFEIRPFLDWDCGQKFFAKRSNERIWIKDEEVKVCVPFRVKIKGNTTVYADWGKSVISQNIKDAFALRVQQVSNLDGLFSWGEYESRHVGFDKYIFGTHYDLSNNSDYKYIEIPVEVEKV